MSIRLNGQIIAGASRGLRQYGRYGIYSLNEIVVYFNGDVVEYYVSLKENNTSAITDETAWKLATPKYGATIRTWE